MTKSLPRYSRIAIAALGVAGLALVSGCSDAKRIIGLERHSPDEFAVVSRAPLSIPPDFTLRPPAPGTVRPQEGTTRERAREAVVGAGGRGGVVLTANGRSPGEMSLLVKAGADKADPDIRLTVDRETSALVSADRSLADRIVFWRDPEPPGSVVDAAKEAQRIRDDQSAGKPVTGGETPVIERGKKALFEGLF